MELKLKRTDFTDASTIGELSVNESFECYTLEDVVREVGVKIPGKTAIPKGRYEVVVTFSNRFQKPLPLILSVPMFEGVRIHPGNTAENTEGCILVGKQKIVDAILQSRPAFEALFQKIQMAIQSEKVFIEIA